MYLLGYDLGSSSIKASIIDAQSGVCVASSVYPEKEMDIIALNPGWAEQEPETWWKYIKVVTTELLQKSQVKKDAIQAIGIGYQMHGLIVVDKKQNVLRPAIIWCDSRAVSIGEKAFRDLGNEECLKSYLNSPGNFTASKLKWIQMNEKHIYDKIDKAMLPGDYIAMKLSGKITTTASGLSEAILWDYRKNSLAYVLLDYFEISHDVIPEIVPTFSSQCSVYKKAADELGLQEGTPITYRAGDQPNNALSLNVLNPGEIAATAGTSGVIYGVTDKPVYDLKTRVNTFIHVNNTDRNRSYGILMCLNGTGIVYSWLKKNYFTHLSYDQMNDIASTIAIGADGLAFLPFGNGAERTLNNVDIGASLHGLQFNVHTKEHILRAAVEGIAFGFNYGLECMEKMGITVTTIKAGSSNMFLCPVFAQTLSNITNVRVELYNTDGSIGAARGAGIGYGMYKENAHAFNNLNTVSVVNPRENEIESSLHSYNNWKKILNNKLNNKGS